MSGPDVGDPAAGGQLTVDQIPVGEGRTVVVEGEQVAVFRLRGGSVRALGARCPHQGGPLADGLVDDTVVVCPLHARAFDLATGAESGGGAAATPWRAVVDDQGVVRVSRPAVDMVCASRESRGRDS